MTITPPGTIDAPTLNKTLRATFDSGRTRPLAWRKAQLAGLRRMVEESDAELVEALRQDLGRPPMEAFVADIGHWTSRCPRRSWPAGWLSRSWRLKGTNWSVSRTMRPSATTGAASRGMRIPGPAPSTTPTPGRT